MKRKQSVTPSKKLAERAEDLLQKTSADWEQALDTAAANKEAQRQARKCKQDVMWQMAKIDEGDWVKVAEKFGEGYINQPPLEDETWAEYSARRISYVSNVLAEQMPTSSDRPPPNP